MWQFDFALSAEGAWKAIFSPHVGTKEWEENYIHNDNNHDEGEKKAQEHLASFGELYCSIYWEARRAQKSTCRAAYRRCCCCWRGAAPLLFRCTHTFGEKKDIESCSVSNSRRTWWRTPSAGVRTQQFKVCRAAPKCILRRSNFPS